MAVIAMQIQYCVALLKLCIAHFNRKFILFYIIVNNLFMKCVCSSLFIRVQPDRPFIAPIFFWAISKKYI